MNQRSVSFPWRDYQRSQQAVSNSYVIDPKTLGREDGKAVGATAYTEPSDLPGWRLLTDLCEAKLALDRRDSQQRLSAERRELADMNEREEDALRGVRQITERMTVCEHELAGLSQAAATRRRALEEAIAQAATSAERLQAEADHCDRRREQLQEAIAAHDESRRLDEEVSKEQMDVVVSYYELAFARARDGRSAEGR